MDGEIVTIDSEGSGHSHIASWHGKAVVCSGKNCATSIGYHNAIESIAIIGYSGKLNPRGVFSGVNHIGGLDVAALNLIDIDSIFVDLPLRRSYHITSRHDSGQCRAPTDESVT